MTTQIQFNDGAAYERYMGRWLDVGCGSGAFTELIFERCAPVSVQGIDPSEGQLTYARQRFGSRPAAFAKGRVPKPRP